jgi:hypothetical protein
MLKYSQKRYGTKSIGFLTRSRPKTNFTALRKKISGKILNPAFSAPTMVHLPV